MSSGHKLCVGEDEELGIFTPCNRYNSSVLSGDWSFLLDEGFTPQDRTSRYQNGLWSQESWTFVVEVFVLDGIFFVDGSLQSLSEIKGKGDFFVLITTTTTVYYNLLAFFGTRYDTQIISVLSKF